MEDKTVVRRSASGETSVSKKPARASDDMLALSVVAALVLLILLVTFLPRPAFQIDRVEYGTSACDPASHSYQVTASMTTRNAGAVASVNRLAGAHIAAPANY